ncbi:MAG TPA: 2-hydroxyacyl-CoA dehydratase [Clostridia bacterium]|nr:2-hydroxyacyl-CoA dehydratase [Clostridia bacterium]
MRKVGITTTIPMEVVYAAGWIPIDLNNVFITDDDPGSFIEDAELAGYPRNICSWIKGLYGTALRLEGLNTVIAVTQGDCSNTHALMETLELKGFDIIPFAFPYDRDYDLLSLQIEKLMAFFGVTWKQVEEVREELREVRKKVWRLDELTWLANKVNGWDNHLFQVSCSDFNGDPWKFAKDTEEFLAEASEMEPRGKEVRLAYIGVPPIVDDLYDYLEDQNARVVFNETQRQFTMPFNVDNIVEQYRMYSYPHGIFYRLEDIERELKKRKIEGVIHYAQSFCYRQIEDLIVRERLRCPVLTIEGDRPNKLDARTRMRIDAFLEILR